MINQFYFNYTYKNKEVNIKKNIPSSSDLSFLRDIKYFIQRDIYNIACSVFILEKIIKKNRFIEKVIIPISPKTYKKINVKSVEDNIQELFVKIIHSEIMVELKEEEPVFTKVRKKSNFAKADAICLFSGGIDSFSGILTAKKEFKKILPLFIAHSDQQGMISIVNKMNNDFLKSRGLGIKTLHAPAINKGGYSQLRGFLYFMLAGMYASLSKTNKIIVTECGPTMYQPRFAPMDEITFTTHPWVLTHVKKILSEFLGEMEIITPFENLTKAEVISVCPDKSLLSKTHSCITQRNRDHDGTCYGCVIRRLGTLVAGVDDVTYNYDVLSKDDNPIRSDGFVSLIKICYYILFDYKNLANYTKENIEIFQKRDLFRRFALDNYSALFIYYNQLNKPKCSFIKKFYNEALKNLNANIFKQRISEVRNNVVKPNFNKKVK
jgi:7-cyano-7-deazaguanine synthase in queuosine biosynthesis